MSANAELLHIGWIVDRLPKHTLMSVFPISTANSNNRVVVEVDGNGWHRWVGGGGRGQPWILQTRGRHPRYSGARVWIEYERGGELQEAFYSQEYRRRGARGEIHAIIVHGVWGTSSGSECSVIFEWRSE
jgi:hypothetical protein